MSLHSVPRSLSSASRKYRESVQSSASDAVTSAVPALPPKPVRKVLLSSALEMYSELCASWLVTTYASTE